MDPVEDEIAGDRVGRRMLDYEHGGPTVLRMLIGLRLRRLREQSGIERARAADHIHLCDETLERMEFGRAAPKQRDVADLLTLYGVTEEADRAELLAMAGQARQPAWWQPYSAIVPAWFEPYLGLEQAARLIRCYEGGFVPGLLQTPDYARAVISLDSGLSEEGVESRVQLRMRRGQLLERADPPKLWAVIDEAVLHRAYGGRDVMRAQLHHLLDMTELPNVTVQVMPLGADNRVTAGSPITILRFPEPELPDVVYVEQTSTALYPFGSAEMDHYWHVMNHLVTQACQPTQTVEVVLEILSRM